MGKGRFREKVAQFMSGRYGADQFSRFLSISGCAAIILALIFSRLKIAFWANLLTTYTFVSLIFSYIRMFSRNFTKRQAENAKYLQAAGKVKAFFQLQKDRFQQRGEYRFYRCPSCKAVARVPRGKGKIRITCRKCGYAFEKRT